MKKYRIIMLIVIGFILVGLIPIILNCLFEHGLFGWRPITTSLNNSDWFSFSGSYIGALASAAIAITGVYLTFKYNQKNNKQIERNSVLPVILFNRMKIIRSGDIAEATLAHRQITELEHSNEQQAAENNPAEYCFYEDRVTYDVNQINEMYYTVINGDIKFTDSLSPEKLSRIRLQGTRLHENGASEMTSETFDYIPLQMLNVGNEAAVNLVLSLYKVENMENIHEHVGSASISLPRNGSMIIGIYIDGDSSNGEYELKVSYTSIHNDMYSQKHKLIISNEKRVFHLEVDQKLEC